MMIYVLTLLELYCAFLGVHMDIYIYLELTITIIIALFLGDD